MSTELLPTAEVDYPTGDGKPMAETEIHFEIIIWLVQTLRWHFRDVPNVHVGGNLLLFYAEGDKRRHVSPDVFLTKGMDKERRLNYLLWKEGRPPNLVIEVTSKSTRREDQEEKRDLYQNVLKVQEYFLFDPLNQYLRPQLKGYRLQAGVYQPIESVRGRLPSEEIGVHFETDGNQLRMFDPETASYLLTKDEHETREAKEQRLRADEQTRRAAEQTRLADQQTRLAEEERQRADQEARSAREERQRADEAEQRIAELMALLAKSQSQQPPTGQ